MAISDNFDTNPRLSRVMLVLITESFAAHPRLVNGVRELNALLRGSIADQMERARIDGSVRPDIDTVTSSALIAGVLRGLTIQWVADPQGVDLAWDIGHRSSTSAVARWAD